MIIDSHAHVYPDKIALKATKGVSDFYDIGMDRPGSVDELLKVGKRAGIDKFLIHSVATTPLQVESINRFISSTVNFNKDKFIGFATTHPEHKDQQAVLEQAINFGLCGVKLHPDFQKFNIDDRCMWPVYSYCEKHAMPILFHTGDYRYEFSSPHLIPRILDVFPDLKLICAHFGGWSEWDEAEKYLPQTNVMVDCSSSFFAITDERAMELIEAFGDDRVLFGSDFPMWDPGSELERLMDLPLSEDSRRKILSENIIRFLGLDI